MVDLLMLRDRLDLPATIISDEELQEMLDACSIIQLEHIGVLAPVNAATDRALIRRVGAEVAAKGMPLGAQNTEFGTVFVPFHDPVLQRLEAPYLLGGFA